MHTGFFNESDRVRRNTADKVNQRIDANARINVRRYAREPRAAIDHRIEQLEREWDIERVLEMNASALALTGVVLGVTVNRRWLLVSGAVLGFLLLHAVQGWCPPLPVLRRLGVRTQSEIDRELLALRHLRGDFDDSPPPAPVRRRLGALVEQD